MMNRLFIPCITPQPRRWVAWLPRLVICMLLIDASSVRAAPPRAVLVLSISETGKQQDSLRAQVGELVQRAGARVVDVAGLSATTRACDEPTCLGALAKEHRVELVLAARIERRSHHERIIDMWLYDADSGQDQSERELCDARDIKDCVTNLAGKLIGSQLGDSPPTTSTEPASRELHPPPATAVTPPPISSVATQLVAPVGSGRQSPVTHTQRVVRLPAWRIGLGTVLTAFAAGSLAIAIRANSMQHDEVGMGNCHPMGSEPNCGYELSPVFIPTYIAAGVLTVGAALVFAIPPARSSHKDSNR